MKHKKSWFGERGTGLALALPLGYGEQRNVPHESEKRYINHVYIKHLQKRNSRYKWHVKIIVPLYPKKFALFAIALLLGVENGKNAGMKLNTVLIDVAVVNLK